jgi:transposase
LRSYARRQAGCKAIQAHYGIGPLTSVVILSELGDARRFSSSREAVRYGGLAASRRAPGRQPCVAQRHAQTPQTQLSHAPRARRRRARARLNNDFSRARLVSLPTPMHRGRLPTDRCRHVRVDGLQRPSGRNASPSGNNTPSTILSPAGSQPQVADRDKPGRPRAHHPNR